MERIPEPELMDDDAQARAYSEADFETPHNTYVELLLAHLGDRAGRAQHVLDLGCGPGDVTCRTAQALPAAHFDGVDGSAAMLKYGHARVQAMGLQDRVRLIEGFLPGAALPRAGYDGVMSNSLLHHLHDPRVLWQAVRPVLQGDTWLFVMDLMRPDTVEDCARMRAEYAAGEPEVLQRDFEASLKAAFTLDEVKAQLDECGLSGCTVRAVSDRHLIVTR